MKLKKNQLKKIKIYKVGYNKINQVFFLTRINLDLN